MDHIPVPRNPVHPPVEVPLFCTNEYTGGPFVDYLERGGLSSDDLLLRFKASNFDGPLHALIQQWAYFGLMSEVFGTLIRIDQFSTTNIDGERLVSAMLLPGLTTKWVDEQRTLSDAERANNKAHVETCIAQVCKVLMEVFLEYGNIDPKLLMSVAVLVENLTTAKPLAFAIYIPDESQVSSQSGSLPSDGIPQAIEFLQERMISDGWCPNEVQMLSLKSSCASLYFISNLERPGPTKDHKKYGCTKEQCIAYQVRHDRYERQHAHPGCKCEDVYSSHGDLLRILRGKEEAIPVLVPFNIDEIKDEKPHVRLVSSALEKEYVAISHVWSDGLGNNEANAIPVCQFNRLSKLVTDLYGGSSRPFWLDTLCFPLEPPEAYELALVRMRSTYQDAHKVLVLDGYLLSHVSSGTTDDEIVTRIQCSPCKSQSPLLKPDIHNISASTNLIYLGNRRLWTLQEGALGSSIAFQFVDKAIDLSHQSETRYDMIKVGDEIFRRAWESFFELRLIDWNFNEDGPSRLVGKSYSALYDMGIVKTALAFRSTSVSDDEALCLSALLNLDIAPILEVAGNDRMRTVWALLGDINIIASSVIFWNDPKLQYNGFRWAPSTLLGGSLPLVEYYRPDVRWAQLTEKGLMVTLPGVLLSGSDKPVRAGFSVEDERGFCFEVTSREDASGTSRNSTRGGNIVDLEARYIRGSELAIIKPTLLGRTYEQSALLVVVKAVSEGIIYVSWLHSVALTSVEGTTSTALKKHIDSDRYLEAVNEAVRAFVPPDPDCAVTNVTGDEDEPKDNLDLTMSEEELDARIDHLTQIPHGQRRFLCNCEAQWVLRGESTRPDQVWCVD